MKRLLSNLGLALLLIASVAAAQQSASSAAFDQHRQATSPRAASAQNDAANRQGGSPTSPMPGRVTGDTPTRVQQELDQHLPQDAQVTASVADDGTLKLTGTVKSDADKAKAEEIARKTSNKDINNQIQVKAAENPR
jgi:osmotically-inducible protein OsmY